MKSNSLPLWDRFQKYYFQFPALDLAVDLSRMKFSDAWLEEMKPRLSTAFKSMAELEAGAIANPDEKRMVGHYWLRNAALAPTPEIRHEIEQTCEDIIRFVADVHSGKFGGSKGAFGDLLIIGIGGSALGPQFVASALGHPGRDKMRVHVFDNTDPDGMERVLAGIGPLERTLCVVISKSGGTKETRNGMLVAQAAYRKAGLDFAKHAVAVTGTGSELDSLAKAQGWLRRFPMWDWVGGRTSVTSAVGLLPAALQGIDIRELLAGAKSCDEITRSPRFETNPAAQLALSWFSAGEGKGLKDMVIIPYKDRLELFSKYLQQLVMESLGKERDIHGKVVNQGIAVYGNKGSTDQHAYIQQLRDGINNFFVTFIRVLKDQEGLSQDVEAGATPGDYLDGFLLGTRKALFENDRQSITLTVREVSPRTVGVLIALYERAVGLYASLVEINAYHQPGVEAGKKAATQVLDVQRKVVAFLTAHREQLFSPSDIADRIRMETEVETVFHILEHLSANPDRGVTKGGSDVGVNAKYKLG